MFLLGVVLVSAGAMFASYGFSAVDSRTPVIVMNRNVPYGTTLTAGDLGTALVATSGHIASIPARRASEVIGKVAAVDLRQGTLLAASELTDAVSPAPGEEVVPVAVKSSLIPARGLRPGDRVLVIATPGAQGQDTGSNATSQPPLPKDIPAAVDQVSSPDPNGIITVDLVVDSQWGPAIEKQSSIGRIGFVITSRRP